MKTTIIVGTYLGAPHYHMQPDFTQGHVIAQGIYHAVKYPVATPLSNLQT